MACGKYKWKLTDPYFTFKGKPLITSRFRTKKQAIRGQRVAKRLAKRNLKIVKIR